MVTPAIILKIESIRNRAKLLCGLRRMLNLKASQDIQKEQWEVLENQLSAVSNKIIQELRLLGDKYLSDRNSLKTNKMVMNKLGELEIELTDAYGFYDTFMDILTQRLSDDVGALLRGCDTIAADAMGRGMIADLTTSPVVYCDRGFGAATLREGVDILKGIPNPIPFISIPYSRLSEKYNLISINHEVGHQALAKLNLIVPFAHLFRTALKKAGAPALVQNLFFNWSREIGPDYWAFCLSGMGQTCSLRDVMILPQLQMFHVSPSAVHPPAYIRFLISTQWCRQLWGKGEWDGWEEEWKALFSPEEMDAATCEIILAARRFIPVVASACITTKFRRLNQQPLSSLFAMEQLNPVILRRHATIKGLQLPSFMKLPIGAQLAVFRLMRESRINKQSIIDQHMNKWLKDIQKN